MSTTRGVAADDMGEGMATMSFAAIFASVVRSFRAACISGVACAVVAVGGFVISRDYAAGGSFVPQASDESAVSRLAGMAAQFGIGLGLSSGGQSIDFYAELLRSREVLETVAFTPFVVDTSGHRASLAEYWGVGGSDSATIRRRAVRKLNGLITVGVVPAAGIVKFRVEMEQRGLAEQVAIRLLDAMQEHNVTRQQAAAGVERDFVFARLNEARDSLLADEMRYRSFLERNREYRASPGLTFEASRLERQVGLRQQLYAGLAQMYEDARIKAVRDVSSIVLVDSPVGSERPAGDPGVVALLAGVVGVFAVVLFGAIRAILQTNAEQGDGAARELLEVWIKWQSRIRDIFRKSSA